MSKAKKTGEDTIIAREKEQITLAWNTIFIEKTIGGVNDNIRGDDFSKQFEEELNKNANNITLEYDANNEYYKITFDNTGNIYSLDFDGIIEWIGKNEIISGEKKVTVTFNANGGELVDSTSKKVYVNNEYGILPTPTKEGYIFKGWCTNINNLFDKNATPINENVFIDSEGIIVSHTEFSIYKVDINPNKSYTIVNSGEYKRPGYAIYDKDNNFICGEGYEYREKVTFVAPDNAAYIKFCVVTNNSNYRYDKDTFEIKESDIYTASTIVKNPQNHTLYAIWEIPSLIIFEDGNQMNDITGGWNIKNSNSGEYAVEFKNNRIEFTGQKSWGITGSSTLTTNNTIDFSKYNKINLKLEWAMTESQYWHWFSFGVQTNDNYYIFKYEDEDGKENTKTVTTTTYSFDLYDEENEKIKLFLSGANNTTGYVYVKKIWLSE